MLMSLPLKEIAFLLLLLHSSHGLDYGYRVSESVLIRVDEVTIGSRWSNKITRNVDSRITTSSTAAKPFWTAHHLLDYFMREVNIFWGRATEFWGVSIAT